MAVSPFPPQSLVRIPILSYQAMRIAGNDYDSNDLKALASDLRQVTAAGFRIVPLRDVVEAWIRNRGSELNGKLVAFVCNAGGDFDYLDLPHPTAGMQRSVLNTLRDFAAEHPGKQARLNITSFVIASPQARDGAGFDLHGGQGMVDRRVVAAAIDSGLMHIANHSWDHNHETLPDSLSPGVDAAPFSPSTRKELADREIGQAADYLRAARAQSGDGAFRVSVRPVEWLPRARVLPLLRRRARHRGGASPIGPHSSPPDAIGGRSRDSCADGTGTRRRSCGRSSTKRRKPRASGSRSRHARRT